MAIPYIGDAAANVAQWGQNINQALGDKTTGLQQLSNNLRYTQESNAPQPDWNTEAGRLNGIIYNYAGHQIGTYNTGNTDDNQQVLGRSSSGNSSYNPEDLAYIDSQMGRLRGQYGKADTALSQGLKSLIDSYNNARSDANFERGRELENLGLKREDTNRGKDRAIDRVDDNARTLRESLLRRIGMASGSDSSAYKFAAPTAVAREASGQRGDVMEDYGVNFRNLGLTEKRANEDYDKLLAAIDADKRSREGKLRSGVENQRQSIDEALAEAAAQRAKLLGGGYDQVRSAMAPYESQIAQRDKTINSLFDKYRTVGKFNPVKVDMPNLRDYTVDRAAIQANEQAGTQDPYAPYRPQIQGDDDDELLV